MVARATNELTWKLGRLPGTSEIATRLELRVEDVLGAVEASAARHSHPLDSALLDADGPLPSIESIGAEDPALELVEDRQSLALAFSTLGARERELIRLRFLEERTQTQIAARLGVSQMQVSLLLRKVLERVRLLAAG